jgi:hypothetical protein
MSLLREDSLDQAKIVDTFDGTRSHQSHQLPALFFPETNKLDHSCNRRLEPGIKLVLW